MVLRHSNDRPEVISISQFIRAIKELPSDKPQIYTGKWYKTQKEHWLGWLREYEGPGAYGRKVSQKRDVKFAYNHIVEPKMLLWLVDAAGVKSNLVNVARRASAKGVTMQEKSAAIRKQVPWREVVVALRDNRIPQTEEEKSLAESAAVCCSLRGGIGTNR